MAIIKTRKKGAASAAKAAGLKSLDQMGAISGKPTSTLKDWYANDRQAFEVMLIGCVTIVSLEKFKDLGAVNVWT